LSAKKARELQNIIGLPSTQDLIYYLDKILIPNCSVIRKNTLRADNIFETNLGSLEDKTMHTTQEHVVIYTCKISPEIMERYRNVTLAMMFINRNPLHIRIYMFSHGRSNERYKKQDYNDVHLASDTAHQGQRFKVHTIFGDSKFKLFFQFKTCS